MAKKLKVEKCGDCSHSSSITLIHRGKDDYRTLCTRIYTDERKSDWRTVIDWRTIPDWCPLEEY